MSSQVMNPYNEVAAFIGCLGFLASVVVMGLLAPWYRTLTGRILFLVKVATFFVLLLVVLRNRLGIYEYIEWVRAVVYTGAALSGWGVTVVILRAQLKGRQERQSGLDKTLWTKAETTAPEWDGVERRKANGERNDGSADDRRAPGEVHGSRGVLPGSDPGGDRGGELDG